MTLTGFFKKLKELQWLRGGWMILAGGLGQETSGKSVVWKFLLPLHCISNHGSHEDTTQGMKTKFSKAVLAGKREQKYNF